MALPQGVWGIDVGQCALKALRLEMIDGQVTATAFDYIEHPKILSQPDADPDALTREALEKFLSRNAIKGDLIAMSVAGQSGLARFVKLPPVEEKKITDIVRFEAKQQIPFPLEEVVWDYQKIGQGQVTDGFALETEIGLFAMKRDVINRYLSHFQAANIEVHIVQMAPLALCNFASYELLKKGGPDAAEPGAEEDDDEDARGKKRCVVALDLGTDSSNLVITDGEKIIWQRPIPLGGNHFTRALTKEMKLTFAKAEHLKRHAAKSADLGQILKALKPVLTEFVGEVQRSLGYFTNTHRDAHVTYMVGLGSAFRLPGLQKFLTEKLQLDVRKPAQFERVTGEGVTGAPVFSENLLSFPVAYGLALQGLGLAKLHTNLLPHEIRFDRMVRAKKPWAVAAAALLMLGGAVYAFGNGVELRSVTAGDAQHPTTLGKAEIKAEATKSAVGKMQSDITAKEGEVSKVRDDNKSIIAGQDERENWLKFNQYVDLCLPRPDLNGGNLTVVAPDPAEPGRRIDQRVYWRNDPAIKALERLKQLQTGSGNTEIPLDYETRQNLPTLDIEAMECRYVEDLEAALKAASALNQQLFNNPRLDGLSKEQQDSPPKGPGWIVELRGYTYNKNGRRFIADTLIYNLNTRAGKPKGEMATPANPSAPAGQPAPADSQPPAGQPAPNGDKAEDPIDGRVSHAFLFYWPAFGYDPSTFARINQSYLPTLTAAGNAPAQTGEQAGPAGPGAPGPGAPGPGEGRPSGPGGFGGAGDSPRTSWQPLPGDQGGGNGAAAGPGEGRPGGPGMPPGPAIPAGPRGPRGPGIAVGGGGPGGIPGAPPRSEGPVPPGGESGQTAPATGQRRDRHEFVAIFFWREPTPSDKLIKPVEGGEAAPGAPAGPAGPSAPGGRTPP
jgi:type IV pilus assembly protein PilM